jgi:hypothetical protein
MRTPTLKQESLILSSIILIIFGKNEQISIFAGLNWGSLVKYLIVITGCEVDRLDGCLPAEFIGIFFAELGSGRVALSAAGCERRSTLPRSGTDFVILRWVSAER